jgi:hypothetical protein
VRGGKGGNFALADSLGVSRSVALEELGLATDGLVLGVLGFTLLEGTANVFGEVLETLRETPERAPRGFGRSNVGVYRRGNYAKDLLGFDGRGRGA